MKILRTTDRNFRYDFSKVFKRELSFTDAVHKTVVEILDDIKRIGDQALTKYTQKFDGHEVNPRTMEVSVKEINAAVKALSAENKKALEMAAEQIEKFYKPQKMASAVYKNGDTTIKLVNHPLERVGVYVPGGKASYPASALMGAIPAKVAGVSEISMCSPWANGEHNPATLVAAHIAGVKQIFKLGGAQAIAAMAYGTKTVPKVDKVIGPGNIYVMLAKKLVYGDVAVDMMAGPSEIVILGDGSVPPAHVAADLLGQAEHDELVCSLLLTTDSNYAIRVEGEVRKQVLKLERRAIASEAIKKRGLIVLVRNMEEAVALVNEIAPQHVELCLEDADEVAEQIKHAGTIFVGPHSPEAIGDTMAGPAHILPTNGCARFSSLLLLQDFIKTTAVVNFGEKAFQKLGPVAAQIARLEGLTGHARALEMRLGKAD